MTTTTAQRHNKRQNKIWETYKQQEKVKAAKMNCLGCGEDKRNPLSKNMIDAKAGDVYIKLPRDKASIRVAEQLIKILETQIKESDTENQEK